MIALMFLSLPYFALDILGTEKLVNHGGECGLEIPANFNFLRLKKI